MDGSLTVCQYCVSRTDSYGSHSDRKQVKPAHLCTFLLPVTHAVFGIAGESMHISSDNKLLVFLNMKQILL